MKKLLAMLMALAMLLSAAALAEDGKAYTLALQDPTVTIGAVTLDLSGIQLDLSAGVTDYGPLSLILEAYAGEEYDYVTGAFAQLDQNGLGLYYNGMQNMYAIPTDVLRSLGADPVLLSALPLMTALAGVNFYDFSVEAPRITAEDRISLLESALGGYVYETLDTSDATVHHFSITREQGAEILTGVMAMLQGFSSELGDLAGLDLAFDLGGAITAKGNPSAGAAEWTVSSSGSLYVSDGSEENVLPISLDYSDDMRDVSLIFSLTNPYGEKFQAAITGSSETTSDGREAVSISAKFSEDDQVVASMRYSVQPEEGTARVDSRIELNSNDGSSFALDMITDFDPESTYSFYAAVTLNDGSGETVADLYFAGDPSTSDTLGPIDLGWVEVTLTQPGSDSIAVNAYVAAFNQPLDTENWVLDSSGAISLATMTEEDLAAVTDELSDEFQSDLATIAEKVPALASLLG